LPKRPRRSARIVKNSASLSKNQAAALPTVPHEADAGRRSPRCKLLETATSKENEHVEGDEHVERVGKGESSRRTSLHADERGPECRRALSLVCERRTDRDGTCAHGRFRFDASLVHQVRVHIGCRSALAALIRTPFHADTAERYATSRHSSGSHDRGARPRGQGGRCGIAERVGKRGSLRAAGGRK